MSGSGHSRRRRGWRVVGTRPEPPKTGRRVDERVRLSTAAAHHRGDQQISAFSPFSRVRNDRTELFVEFFLLTTSGKGDETTAVQHLEPVSRQLWLQHLADVLLD